MAKAKPTRFYEGGVDHLHLEPTSACDVNCPQCSRNWLGSDITPVEMFDGEFKPNWIKRFSNFNFAKATINGNYGDICSHTDPLALLNSIKLQWSKISLQINSHGSGLDPETWKQIGLLGWIGRGCLPVHVHFAIDGTDQSTHSKYRRGTDLDKIFANVAGFIEGGGIATWVFTEFEHNKHQLEEARYLCEAMGFDQFVVRPSMRHIDSMPSPVVNNEGDIVDWLGPPRDSNPDFDKTIKTIRRSVKTAHIKKQYSVSRTDVDVQFATAVNCWAKINNAIYVDARGFLYPCGWLGKPMLWKNVCLHLRTSYSFNDTADYNPINIIDHEFFDLLNATTTDNSLSPCQRACGKNSKYSKMQAQSSSENFKDADAVDIRV